MNKLAVVTGATGCVGRNLVNELLLDGWSIIALHRKSSNIAKLNGLNIKLVESDLYDLNSVLNSVPEDVDAIFHVAGNTSHWSGAAEQQWKDNVLATRNLIEAAFRKKVKRFIFTSTGATYAYQGSNVEFASQINSGYIRTKRLSEIEIEGAIERGLDAVILQPIIVVGPYDYHNYTQIFKKIKSGKIPGSLPGRLAFCHAQDVAKAHVAAFHKGQCGEYYMLGGEYTTWLDVFQRIAKRLDAKPIRRVLPRWILLIMAFRMVSVSFFTRKEPELSPELVYLLRDSPDVPFTHKRRAFKDLGYTSQSLDKMLADCHSWMLEEKIL